MKRSRFSDLKEKEATILGASATLTSQTRVTLYKCIVSQLRDVLIVLGFIRLLQQRYLVSANRGWALQILFPVTILLAVIQRWIHPNCIEGITHTPKGDG